MNELREMGEGDRAQFPISIDTDVGRVLIGGMIIGVKDGKTVILDLVIIDEAFTDMFPGHWMGMSIPRYEEPIVEPAAELNGAGPETQENPGAEV